MTLNTVLKTSTSVVQVQKQETDKRIVRNTLLEDHKRNKTVRPNSNWKVPMNRIQNKIQVEETGCSIMSS